MADNTSIPIIVQGNSFSLAIPLQKYVIVNDEMVLQDYTPAESDVISIQLKGSRRSYTYSPTTIVNNDVTIQLGGYELADIYAVVVSIVKANGQRLRSFRTDQFFIVESSDDLTQADIVAGLEDNVIYLDPSVFVMGEKGDKGDTGVGIASIAKTSTSGLVDTYTITYTNGNTTTFTVTNGEDGHDLGLAQIINNLTSDSTEDALSAKMGKELNTKIATTAQETQDILAQELNEAVASITPITIEGNVTNAPDEEDLTSYNNGEEDVLRFKDKAYTPLTYSGLGRKYLRKNIVNGANILTSAMVADANTVYHIQYDYDLGGATITMPAGATLKFEGGSLKNGTIEGNGTSIIAGNVKIFDTITFSGTFTGSLNAFWIGAKSKDSNFDNSPILQAWFTSYSAKFRVIEFPLDNYYFLTPCVKNNTNRYREIRGNNSNFYVNIPDAEGEGQYFLTIKGENFTLKDVNITNVRKTTVGSTEYNLTKTRGLYLNQAQLFSLSGVTISYFDVGIHIDDVWYGGFSGINSFVGNRISVLALNSTSDEVNTVDFRNVRFRGILAENRDDTIAAVWPQNDGESDANYAMRTANVALDFHCITNNCKFDSCTIENFDYGIRFSYKARSSDNGSMKGIASITKCYFEANRTYDIYVGRGYVINPNGYSYSLYTLMELLIESCLFHSLKKCYFKDAIVTMIRCHETVNVTIESANSSAQLIHDGCANCVSSRATRMSSDSLYWQFNGDYTSSIQNLRCKLESHESENIGIAPYYIATPLTSTLSPSNQWYIIGAAVRRSFEMYPTIGMQDIIQPLRCEYDAQKNAIRVEVKSGGVKRFASADYTQVIRCLSNKADDSIPLFEFLRRWDAGASYTGKVSHLYPYSITANPSTGVITDSNGTVIGFGKKAIIDGNFNPASFDIGTWIDVDSMCVVVRSRSYTKFSSDLIQCGRNYNEILPHVDAITGSGNRLYYGTSTQRDNVAKRINAVYLNTDTGKYEIFNGFGWIELTSRYQRYEYVEHGSGLAERPYMADFVGQTFTDDSTGITYVFWVNATHTSWGWKSINNNVGATANRPSLDWGANGYQFYDTTIKRNIYSKMGKSVEKTETVGAGSQSTATVKTVENTLTEGRRYWVGYSTKQSWGGKVSFRRAADSSAGEITILSNFNDNAKGTYFTAPSTTDFPYIYMSNKYDAAETVTFEVPATSWIEDDGATAGVARSGDTASRPASADIYTGFEYFDTDLGLKVVWNGSAWIVLPKYEVVNSLPASPDSNTLYLIAETS